MHFQDDLAKNKIIFQIYFEIKFYLKKKKKKNPVPVGEYSLKPIRNMINQAIT